MKNRTIENKRKAADNAQAELLKVVALGGSESQIDAARVARAKAEDAYYAAIWADSTDVASDWREREAEQMREAAKTQTFDISAMLKAQRD